MKVKTVDSSCKGCIYLMPIACAETKFMACDYIGATNKSRPCPAGKGCTVRKTGKKVVRRFCDV